MLFTFMVSKRTLDIYKDFFLFFFNFFLNLCSFLDAKQGVFSFSIGF